MATKINLQVRLVPGQLNISCTQLATVHSVVPPYCKNTVTPFKANFLCSFFINFFTATARIDQKHFQALFHTPTTLQTMPSILLYISGSLKYNISFQKTLPWQLLSPYVLPDFTPALVVTS